MWKKWKGTAPAAYAISLIFHQWLPGVIVALCYLAGIVVLCNLLFHFLRYLKNRIFWRVRYRIIGAFIFVGVLPVLLIAGILCLSAYLLPGQLSRTILPLPFANWSTRSTRLQ